MELSEINLLAVLTGAIIVLLLGLVWYAPAVFGKLWKDTRGHNPFQGRGLVAILAPAFVLICVMGIVLSAFMPPAINTPGEGALFGLIAGLGLGATSVGIHHLLARRPVAVFLIEAGYLVIAFVVFGVVITFFA